VRYSARKSSFIFFSPIREVFRQSPFFPKYPLPLFRSPITVCSFSCYPIIQFFPPYVLSPSSSPDTTLADPSVLTHFAFGPALSYPSVTPSPAALPLLSCRSPIPCFAPYTDCAGSRHLLCPEVFHSSAIPFFFDPLSDNLSHTVGMTRRPFLSKRRF